MFKILSSYVREPTSKFSYLHGRSLKATLFQWLCFTATEATNRDVKNLLIKLLGEDVCFMYPKDRSKSEMFFSRSVTTEDLVEKLRSNDLVTVCAKLLREEVENYNFHLDDSYNAAGNLITSYIAYREGQPLAWQKSFDSMFPKRKYHDGLQRKCDTVFQIMHALIQKKKTPLHVLRAQTIHDASRSEKVVKLMNRLGLSISYDEMM